MRRTIAVLCIATICLWMVTMCHGAPAPATTLDRAESSAIEPQNDREVIEIINLSNFGQTDRDKRDINMLRQLFPGIAQIFDRLIQEIISQTFRVFGRVLLQSGGLGSLLGGGGGGGLFGGGGGGGNNTSSAGRVSVSLPTFPPDEDEDEDEDAVNTTNNNTPSNTQNNTADSEDNSLSGSESQNNEVRVKFNGADQVDAASGPSPVEDVAVEDDDADRNKRYLPFGGGGGAAGDHGAAGGSGNFLFDIIRSTADRAARAAGTVYRMVAGTENLGLGLSATATSTKTIAPAAQTAAVPPQLVAGSGSGSGSSDIGDQKANGAVAGEVDIAPGADGYTEGVPGPITRLFVIANRGIANLIQDLILRMAQTSERIVNFKARLINALI